MPIVSLVCGPAGSGKSTKIRALRQPGEVVVSRDEVRANARASQPDITEAEVWQRFLDQLTEHLQAGLSVILDATFANPARRQEVITVAKRYGARVVAVVMFTSLANCMRRNADRVGTARLEGPRVRELFYEFWATPPSLGEGFDHIQTEL